VPTLAALPNTLSTPCASPRSGGTSPRIRPRSLSQSPKGL
jgi:hypothetical protein